MEDAIKKTAVVLLAEDDLGDQELTRRCFMKSRIRNDLHIVSDGEEALDYLLRRGQYTDPKTSPRPDLVLLDLNMPKVDGRQVLKTVLANDDLRTIPIVVMTTSNQEADIVKSYDVGANSYIVKPVDIAQFSKVLEMLENYWFEIVVMPKSTISG